MEPSIITFIRNYWIYFAIGAILFYAWGVYKAYKLLQPYKGGTLPWYYPTILYIFSWYAVIEILMFEFDHGIKLRYTTQAKYNKMKLHNPDTIYLLKDEED